MHTARLLANLALNDANRAAIAAAGAILPLVRLLGSASEGVQEQAARALEILAVNSDDNPAAIAAADAIPPLVRLLGSRSAGVQERAAGLANLAVTDANRAALAAAGAILPLVRPVGSGREGVPGHRRMGGAVQADPGLQDAAARALANLRC